MAKFKSKLEGDFAAFLKKSKIKYDYEATTFPYVRPSHYTPDWRIGPKTFLETKGEFSPSQRANLLAFLEQHPDVKIIMVFANAENKLTRKSKTNYGDWCNKYGIEFYDLQAVWNPKTRHYTFKNKIKIINENNTSN